MLSTACKGKPDRSKTLYINMDMCHEHLQVNSSLLPVLKLINNSSNYNEGNHNLDGDLKVWFT